MATISVPYHLDELLPESALGVSTATRVVRQLPDGDVWQRLGALYPTVADEVAAAVRRGEVPSVISGDCMVSLAVLAGLQRAEVVPSVVWFDAHGDVQSPETTESGYAGGMPLRLAVGDHPELLADAIGLRPLPESRVLLVGARDLDRAEAEYLESSEIARAEVEEAAEELPDGPILLHIDLDVIDAAELSDLRFPVTGGPSADAVLDAARRIMATGRVRALDIACTWYPGAPVASRTRIVEELLAAVG
ncbi:arginase [Saccharopolyspora kobensis]|uniref:Arginase n=1 Tax=Saccharopolyspora kobensis TaxID=146035 RepID=A0A1H6EB48_9PSEU|nr:arginase family protein [Saccharopolyspora kobensis]SEG94491.1 arginase [Saccharopolyspora kobensis]SFD64733.1 arginase [Saccharopolyspora kobensis]